MTRYGFGDSDAQQLSTQFVNAAATAQKHVRWVACTESSCCEGGRDVSMRGECKCDADGIRSTEAGRGRGVFDARATIQRHVRWVAHRQQISAQTAAMPRAGAMGECVAIAGVMWTSRAAPAQVEIASFPMRERCVRATCARQRARKAAVARAGAMAACVASAGVMWKTRAAPRKV